MEKASIYIHIPKTAGRTLESIIRKNCDPEEIFRIYGSTLKYSFPEIARLEQRNKSTTELYMGHIFFGLHRYISRQAMYFTFLRNPIDRVISHYYYVSNNHELQNIVSKMSLLEYLEQDPTLETNNGQTRHIAGLENDVSSFDYLRKNKVKKEDLNNEVALLQKAKHNIQKYFFMVGLTERFEESLIVLSKHLGWKNLYYIKKNVSKTKPKKYKLNSKLIQLIEDKNKLDIELYKYAKNLFDKRIREYDKNYLKKIKNYQKKQQIYSFITNLAYNAKRIERKLAKIIIGKQK